jgi:RNA polymerase sigma factor (sigma-70 family)
MMRVIRSMKPMPTEDDLRRWLGVVVRSCAYDRLRTESRARGRQRRGDTATRAEPDLELHGRIRWLEQELRSMSSCNAELLLMRYRFGWTLQKIANALGLKPGAVDGQLRRLVGMLRRRAGEQHDE